MPPVSFRSCRGTETLNIMARENEERKPQEQRDETDHGVIVAGADAHEREQSGKAPADARARDEASKRGKDRA